MHKSLYLQLFMIAAIAMPASAQKQEKAHEERVSNFTYSMPFPDNVAPAKAKATVLEQARIEAIAKVFGTNIHSQSINIDSSVDGKFSNTFVTKSESDVQGEWIEDLSQPQWSAKTQGSITEYSVTISGRVRQWLSSTVDLDVRLLRNGVDTLLNKLHDGTYYNGDNFYLYFRTPRSGFLSVYITEEMGDHQMAQRILPYPKQDGEAYAVTADEEYYFFAPQKANAFDRHTVIPLKMGCREDVDINKLYVIYSPNPFVRAADAKVDDSLPNQLSLTDFNRWLTNRRRHDQQTQVESCILEIKKN